MVEKIPANGGPKELEELTPLEVALLNRILIEFPNGVELPELFMQTRSLRASLEADVDMKEFKEMILSFAPKFVNLKILVYPKLTEPILLERKNLKDLPIAE